MFTILSGATVTVYDAAGKKLDPQPTWNADPPFGPQPVATMKIKFPNGLPNGYKVVISQINTHGTDPAPTGAWSS